MEISSFLPHLRQLVSAPCQYRLHDYSDEWPCTCGLADVWDGSGESGVVTQYALLADHLGERIQEFREALEACEAREAVYRNQCLHHTLCGWRVGEACDCWLSEVQQDGAALLRQALGVAREIIETITAEHDEDRASLSQDMGMTPPHGPCDCDVCLRGWEFLGMRDEVGVEPSVGQGGVVVRETSRVGA